MPVSPKKRQKIHDSPLPLVSSNTRLKRRDEDEKTEKLDEFGFFLSSSRALSRYLFIFVVSVGIANVNSNGIFVDISHRNVVTPENPNEVRIKAKKWKKILRKSPFQCERTNEIIELVHQGVPHGIRSRVWPLLLSTHSVRRISKQSYAEYMEMAINDPNSEANRQINLDLARTYIDNAVFSVGYGQQQLYNILSSYACRNREVGYCQGMSYIAGLLLLVMEEEDAFWSFVSIIENHMPGFFDPSLSQLHVESTVFGKLLSINVPEIAKQFFDHDIHPLVYTARWFLSAFSMLPCWESVLCSWDLFCLYGIEGLHRIGIAIIRGCEDEVLKLHDATQILPYLVDLPALTTRPTILLTESKTVDCTALDEIRQLVKSSLSPPKGLPPRTPGKAIKRKKPDPPTEPLSLFARLATPLRQLTGRFEGGGFRFSIGTPPVKKGGKASRRLFEESKPKTPVKTPPNIHSWTNSRSLREFATPTPSRDTQWADKFDIGTPGLVTGNFEMTPMKNARGMTSPIASPLSPTRIRKSLRRQSRGRRKSMKRSKKSDELFDRIVKQSTGK